MNYRTLVLLALLLSACFGELRAAEPANSTTLVRIDGKSVARYLLSCRKANGAFGPIDQDYTDAAWNYPAVHALRLLGEPIDEPEKTFRHGRGFPTGHAGLSHWLLFHQAMLERLLLGDKLPTARPVSIVHQGAAPHYYGHPLGRKNELLYKLNAEEFYEQTRGAEELGYYHLASLCHTLAAVGARGASIENAPELVAYILRRQAPCGGFADVRGDSLEAADADAHLATTWQAIGGLKLLGAEIPQPERVAAFVQQCQGESGAFRARLDQALPGNVEDVYYTWAAAQTLQALGQQPSRPEQLRAWLHTLQNADGGFGDQPGWRSRLYSTYYAVHTLALLDPDGIPRIDAQTRPLASREAIPPGEFEIYQGLNKTPVCEPADLAGLNQRKLNLLGIKSDKFELAEKLRVACHEQRLPMDVALCFEAYPHRARWQSDVLLDHVANITLDPAWDETRRNTWRRLDERGQAGLPWPQFQLEALRPLQQLAGPIYPEQDFEMEHAYAAYDAGLAGAEGYQAMLAGFNWIPRDFIRVFHWRERYVDKLTLVADCDAHGDLAKWSPQLDHTRHLFLAKEPTYSGYLAAAAAGRVVCVIVSPDGAAAGVAYYGRPAAVAYVRARIDQWRWWE